MPAANRPCKIKYSAAGRKTAPTPTIGKNASNAMITPQRNGDLKPKSAKTIPPRVPWINPPRPLPSRMATAISLNF